MFDSISLLVLFTIMSHTQRNEWRCFPRTWCQCWSFLHSPTKSFNNSWIFFSSLCFDFFLPADASTKLLQLPCVCFSCSGTISNTISTQQFIYRINEKVLLHYVTYQAQKIKFKVFISTFYGFLLKHSGCSWNFHWIIVMKLKAWLYALPKHIFELQFNTA